MYITQDSKKKVHTWEKHKVTTDETREQYLPTIKNMCKCSQIEHASRFIPHRTVRALHLPNCGN